MQKTKKNILTAIAAIMVTGFSLCSCVVGAIAWFAVANQANAKGETFKVIADGSGYDIQTVDMYKYNYRERQIGSGATAVTIIDYLQPEYGSVHKYAFNDQEETFGEEVNSVWQPVTMMNLFDPIDLVVQRHSLIDLNCNVVYEVTLSSSRFTNCYLHLNAFRLTEKTKTNSQIFLTDCIDFDVYTAADLADNNSAFQEAAPNAGRYHKYYPSYKDKSESLASTEEETYYKISYLASLNNYANTNHAHFYGNQQKPEDIEVTKNRAATFVGEGSEKTLKLYINVNYAVSELNKYSDSIYRSNIHAVFDFAFEFKISAEAVI